MAEDSSAIAPLPAECNLPAVIGFTIGLRDSNMILHIQDTNGNKIPDAVVTVVCGANTFDGTSDADGCVSVVMKQNEICTITITKSPYKNYIAKVILLPNSVFADPLKNFIIMVTDTSDTAISGASVDIKVGVVTTNSGTTNASGIFEGEIDTGSVNDLTISKAGYNNFTHQFQDFLPFHCDTVGFRLVPVIQMITP